MKKVVHHIRHRSRKHRSFLLIISVVLAGGVFVNIINGLYIEKEVVGTFRKNFEKQASSQLDAYSYGLQSVIETRLSLQLSSLENLVNQPEVRASLLDKTYDDAEEKFTELINYDQRFDSVYAIDQNGIIRMAVNKEADRSGIGRDASGREYFNVTTSTKQPYIGNAFLSRRNNSVIPFCVPIFDNQDNLVAIVVAGAFLSNLAESVSLPKEIPGLYFSVIDAQGNLLISKGEALNEIKNIEGEDTLVTALVSTGSGSIRVENNYLGDKVFAKGAGVEVGGNNFFVISYYLQSRYDHDLSVIRSDYDRSLFTSRIRSLMIFFIGALIVFRIIKNHEKVPEK